MTNALRAGSRALLTGTNLVPPSGSQIAASDNSWLLAAIRGHIGDTPGARQSCVGQALAARHGHDPRALLRTPVLLIIPSAVDPPARERAGPNRSRCSAQPDERS
jgi:hypothetical protein